MGNLDKIIILKNALLLLPSPLNGCLNCLRHDEPLHIDICHFDEVPPYLYLFLEALDQIALEKIHHTRHRRVHHFGSVHV